MSHSTFVAMEAAAVVLALAAGVWWHGRLANWGPVGRVGAAFLPLLLSIWFGECLMEWHVAPESRWNGARLAPAFALRLGLPMYHGPDEGPVLGNIYGPGLAVAYLPATLCALPSLALTFGAVLASWHLFAPAALLTCVARPPGKSGWVVAAAGFVLFAFIVLGSPPLRYAAFWIHADAPALGLCAAACALLRLREKGKPAAMLAGAALCATLAVWTKQTAAPILVALPLYLWLMDGRRVCVRFSAALVATLAAVTLAVCLLTDARAVFFNMFTVPSRHPWIVHVRSPDTWITSGLWTERAASLLSAGAELCGYVWLPVLALAGHVLLSLAWNKEARSHRRIWLRSQGWFLPAIVAACMLPTALLGRVKVGGDINSLSYVAYFLAAAVALALMEVFSRVCWLRFEGMAGRVAALTALTLIVLIWQLQPMRRLEAGRITRRTPALEDQAVRHLQAHPDETYFPWNPLVHLMGEGKARHFAYGVFDRELAGFPVNTGHYRAHLPGRLRRIALIGSGDTASFDTRLPEFRRKIELAELKAWTVYVASDEAPAPAHR